MNVVLGNLKTAPTKLTCRVTSVDALILRVVEILLVTATIPVIGIVKFFLTDFPIVTVVETAIFKTTTETLCLTVVTVDTTLIASVFKKVLDITTVVVTATDKVLLAFLVREITEETGILNCLETERDIDTEVVAVIEITLIKTLRDEDVTDVVAVIANFLRVCFARVTELTALIAIDLVIDLVIETADVT